MRPLFVTLAAAVLLPWAACAGRPTSGLGDRSSATSTGAEPDLAPDASAGAGSASPTSAAIAPLVPGSSTGAAPAGPDETAVELPTPPKPTAKDRQSCASLGAKVDAFLASSRSCKTAADCVDVRTSCGTTGVCGTYIARDKQAALEPLSDSLESAQCFAKGLVPCPSCVPLGPPACVGGKCQAVR